MITNALNVQLDTYILQIKIQKDEKSLVDELDFEDIKFRVKIEYIHKILKNVSIGISVFGYGNKVKYPTYVPENVLQALASGVQG